MAFSTPKGCIVRSVHVEADGAKLSLDCRGADYTSTYRHVFVRGVRSIDMPNATIDATPGTRVGFVLMPRSTRCSLAARAKTLKCTVK